MSTMGTESNLQIEKEFLKVVEQLDCDRIIQLVNDPAIKGNLDLLFFSHIYMTNKISDPSSFSDEKFLPARDKVEAAYEDLLNAHVKENYMNDSILDNNVAISSSPLPKIFHLVWLGNLFPEEAMEDLRKLCVFAKRSGYKVMLWTDSVHKQHKIFDRDLFISKDTLMINGINELLERVKIDPDFNKKLTDYGGKTKAEIIVKVINEEMHGLRNLASASDYLRLLALKYYGRIYKDHDDKVIAGAIIQPIGDVCLPFGFGIPSVFFEEQWQLRDPESEHTKYINANNTPIAMQPHHPLALMALDQMLAVNALQEKNTLSTKPKGQSAYTMKYKDKKRLGDARTPDKFNLTVMMGPECCKRAANNLIASLAEKEKAAVDTKYLQKGMLPYEIIPTTTSSGDVIFHIGQLKIKQESAQTWMKTKNDRKKGFEI